MAKTIMPLLSAEASGKIAKSLVFFYWKGLNVVRKYTIPANPRSVDMKSVRTKLAALGKNIAAMTTAAPAGKIVTLLKAAAPANLIWNSYFVKAALDQIKSEAVFTAAELAYTSHTRKDEFDASAADLGMSDILPGVAFSQTVSAGFQLYLGAYAAQKLGLVGTTNYGAALSGWVTKDITSFAKDYTTA
jgi:hypothetical protein